MKKYMCILLVIVGVILSLCGCGQSQEHAQDEKLIFYGVTNMMGFDDVFISSYNSRVEYKDKINIVEFEDENALKSKLSTELMTGNGPDIISLTQLINCDISYERLIEQGCFKDINEILKTDRGEDKINLNDYNKKALQGGVYKGKRYCIPLYYTPLLYTTSKQRLFTLADTASECLSYKDIITISESISKSNSDLKLLSNPQNIISDYITERVNLKSKTFDFSGDFIKTVEKIKNLENTTEEYSDSLALYSDCFSPYAVCDKMAALEDGGEEPVILGYASLDTDNYKAQLDGIFFINKGCKKYEQILKFLKICLSEETQSDCTGAKITKYNPDYSNYSGGLYPVNNASFKTLMKNTGKVKYQNDSADISQESVKHFKKVLNEITSYSLPPSTNYMAQVADELISDYVAGKITAKKFKNDLTSKTKLYLEE